MLWRVFGNKLFSVTGLSHMHAMQRPEDSAASHLHAWAA
ncbi:hypothetical protein CES86_5156 [Brucella lupini]|uniref:Uncharacterized protein n=1 Tax=Brucella lupini TaxID=255457 RepID=A0A256GA68_9HYPH|nr:hypothetical protein CES86_5156 [Brucella lupini]